MKKCITIIIIVLLALQLKAQVPADLASLLDFKLDSMRTAIGIKSLSAAIVFPDYTWAKAAGVSQSFPNTPANTNMAYLIGSTTKTLTAACIMQLVDEQKLSLEDSIYRYVDTIPNINPNITIKQLLQHKTGIKDVLLNPAWNQASSTNPSKVWDAEELLRTFNLPTFTAPGGAWDYSNPNYFLLGMIIKRVTGHPFYEELRTRFFNPMGLSSFGIPSFETLDAPVAHPWMDLNGDGVTDDAYNVYFNWNALNSAAGAAGGYYATPTDVATWIRAYMRGDLHSADALTQIKTTFSAPGAQGGAYGLGIMKNNLGGLQCFGHGGDLVYTSSAWYFPMKDMGISILANDQKFDSWKLLPVVTVLVRACREWEATTSVGDAFFFTPFEVSALPNPIDNVLNVKILLPSKVDEVRLVLTDLAGRTIKEVFIHDAPEGVLSSRLDQLEYLQKGIYVLTVYRDALRAKSVKVVKD